MILDGIENCIQYIDNFDPDKSSNPFSYFTQIIYYAFLRRISKEKKQAYIKNKLVMDMPIDSFDLQEQDEDGQFQNAYLEFIQNNTQDFSAFEEKQISKKKKKKDTLEEFIGDNDGEVNT
jgi:DNA-directed RNA polymerase specialized sigma24 family protein